MKLIILLLAVALSGCGTIAMKGKTVTDALILDQVVQSGAPAAIVLSANLSDKERATVNNAIAYAKFFRHEYMEFLIAPENTVVNLSDFKNNYASLVTHYIGLKRVFDDNIEDYSDEQIQMMRAWHQDALGIHLETSKLIGLGEKNSAIIRSIDFVMSLIGGIK